MKMKKETKTIDIHWKYNAMFFYVILYLLFAFNLINVISEKSSTFYKDVRFWLVIVSLIVLVVLTAQSYPV